jgi:PDZ-binding kinase
MERGPISGGYRSPWAVKKVAKRYDNQENQDFSKRLLEEAEILKKLEHPHIIGFRTLTKALDGTWCMAMEKAENSLMDLIEQRLDNQAGPFLPQQINRVGVDIAKALDYLHTEKLLMHGDMKSGNVLIFGDFRMAKLCDFGVTMTLNEANGRVIPEQFYVGTQAWSAPEVIKLDETFENDEVVITSKADMFSYGESRSTVSIKSLIILIPCVSGSRFDHLGDVQFVRPTC